MRRRLEGSLDCTDGNYFTELYQLTGETGSYRYMSPEVRNCFGSTSALSACRMQSKAPCLADYIAACAGCLGADERASAGVQA